MAIIVQKYGGTSVADPDRIKNVARRIIKSKSRGDSLVVVVSAIGDTTDQLIQLARQITPEPRGRELDMLLSTGEQVSIALLAMAIHAAGESAVSLTGAQVGIRTDGVFQKAKITDVDVGRLRGELEKDQVVIVAGFQGVAGENEITTLGRGGSDTTAVALAAALGAESCEIYTDVDGVYSADPRVVPSARKLPEVSYDEMLELASLGARVLHLRSVELAKKYDVTLHVRSSFKEDPGTLVKGESAMEKGRIVTGIAHDLNVAKVTLAGIADRPGVAATIFGALGRENINVDMIIQSAGRDQVADISFTVSRDDLVQALVVSEAVGRELGAASVYHDANLAKVSIVGAGMISNPGVAGTMFATLAAHGVNIEMISTSDISISCVIKQEAAAAAVRALHQVFVERTEPSVGQKGDKQVAG